MSWALTACHVSKIARGTSMFFGRINVARVGGAWDGWLK